MQDLARFPATEMVRRLRWGDVAPLELIDAAAARVAAGDLAVGRC